MKYFLPVRVSKLITSQPKFHHRALCEAWTRRRSVTALSNQYLPVRINSTPGKLLIPSGSVIWRFTGMF